MSGRTRSGTRRGRTASASRDRSLPPPGREKMSPPQETTDALSDDSSDTEPLKTGKMGPKRPKELNAKKETDLNGTTETDITDATLSPRSDIEDGSIAVDCPHGPAEVIVQGKNVRKIRVKFPPHPLSLTEERLTPKPPSGRSRKRSSDVSIKSKSSPTEDVPFSQEEQTPGSDQSQSSIWPSSFSSSVTATSGCVSNSACVDLLSQRSVSHDFGLHVGTIDMDKKFRQDILNGIEYFDSRTEELKSANRRMAQEIERLTTINADLDARFKDIDSRFQGIIDENDELKVKLDELSKEKMRLEEQAVDQWQGRVKVEEMFTEMKRDSDKQLQTMRQELKDVKDKKSVPVTAAAASVEKKTPPKSRHLDSNNMELLRKMSLLQDQLAKAQMDKAMTQEANRKLEKELADAKNMYEGKSRELDAQYKRFLSLKKSFNDLTDQHEKLRSVLRNRGVSTSGNSTWPSNKSSLGVAIGNESNETVRLVDISAKVTGTLGAAHAPSYLPPGQKASKSTRSKIITHKRNTSDGIKSIVTEANLPPVTPVSTIAK